jgi:hypothetical protein
MFSSRTQFYAPSASRSTASSPSLSEIRSTPLPIRTSSVPLRQLIVTDLNEFNRSDSSSRRTEPFRIPRPVFDLPPLGRRNSDHRSLPVVHLYQPEFNTPVPIRTPHSPIQYQVRPVFYSQFSPKKIIRRIKDKRYVQEKTPGLCATCCSGGCGAFAVIVYLLIVLALPTTKLVLGILYREECPLNKSIPLYMIVAGSAGIAIVLFLLLSSSCTYCRSSIKGRKGTHGLMIITIGFARGMQAVLAIFLFVWFFIGNFWIFSVRPNLQTERAINGNNNNYCHPVLYWPAFYILIFTYVITILICLTKFFARLVCCGACDLWKGAFS